MFGSQGREGAASDDRYVPALRFRALTGAYDLLIRVTTRERRFKRRLLERASLRPGERVLDLGCGTGTLAFAARQAQPEASVTGLDGDVEILARARAKAVDEGAEVSFVQGLATELPFPDGSFDVVLSSLFFHHLAPDAKRATARELVRVLALGGRVHVADWGPPQDPLMGVLFLGVRLLDGFEPTRDNAAGRLPAIFRDAGFAESGHRERLRTLFGSLAFYEGSRVRR